MTQTQNNQPQNRAAQNKEAQTIAYFVSEFPARSHTFIRRERDAMIDHGTTIAMHATRRCNIEDLKTDDEKKDHESTWSILPIDWWSVIRTHWRLFSGRPKRYVKTLRKAFKHRLPGAKNALWSAFYFAEAGVLAERLKTIHAKHLHVHFANAGASIGYLAHQLTGIPWSMTLHGACDFEYPAGPLLKDKLESVKHAIFVSKYGMSQAMRQVSPDHWEKFKVVRCGIEPHQLLPFSQLPREFSGPPTVYCIGRLSSEKGQLGMLEAFARLREKMPSAQLKMIGDGPDGQRLLNRSHALGIGDHVAWLGAVSEQTVIDHLRHHAHVLALPSFMEGIPMVLMEAMGNGVPVVAPRIAGIPELVIHQTHGMLYHPADWQDLADRLYDILTNTPLQQTLTINAWKKVDEEFRIDTATKPLAELFQQ